MLANGRDCGRLSSAMPSSFRIALLMDVSYSYWREVLGGVYAYAKVAGDWRFQFRDRQKGVFSTEDFGGGGEIDGIVGAYLDPVQTARLQKQGLPVVSVSNRFAAARGCRVISDDRAIGTLAAEHFLERGFRSFGFVGFGDHPYSDERAAGYFARIEQAALSAARSGQAQGFAVATLPIGQPGTVAQDLEHWLAERPKPLAVFGASDLRARSVIEAAVEAGISVPYEVAVLGVDNDFLQNVMSPVPLSSIELDGFEVGFRAAEMLGSLLRRQVPARESERRVAPRRIIVRQSSDVLAVADTQLVRTLEWMQTHFMKPVDVAGAVRASGLSRRVLERRFRAHLGRTPAGHLLELRLARARELLVTTDWAIQRIADECGFTESRTFIARFRTRLNITPAAYRRSLRQV